MKYQIIIKKNKGLIDKIEKEYKKYDFRFIIKQSVSSGLSREEIAHLISGGIDIKELEEMKKEIRFFTTIGWKMNFGGDQYGDWLKIDSISEDYEYERDNKKRTILGNTKLDDRMVKACILLLKEQAEDEIKRLEREIKIKMREKIIDSLIDELKEMR